MPQHPLCPWPEQGTSEITARSRTMLHPRAGKLWHKGEEVRSVFIHFTVWYHLSCTELQFCIAVGEQVLLREERRSAKGCILASVRYWPSNREDQTNRSRSSFAERDSAKSKCFRGRQKWCACVQNYLSVETKREDGENNFVGWNGRGVFRNLPLITDA